MANEYIGQMQESIVVKIIIVLNLLITLWFSGMYALSTSLTCIF